MKGSSWVIFILCFAFALSFAVNLVQGANLRLSAGKINGLESCQDYLISKGVSGDLSQCDLIVQGMYLTADRAEVCDSGLRVDTLTSACSAPVQALYAGTVDLDTKLKAALEDQDDAIARAEARGKAQTTRKTQNDRALAAAPRQPDGLIVCDADCLRSRFTPVPPS